MAVLETPFAYALNRLLEAEPWARERLAPFVGETVELRAPYLPAVRFAIVEGGRLAPGGEPSLRIALRAGALAALARGEDHFMREVDIEGNARLAQEVLHLARHLRWDAEEALSRFFGDIAAKRIADAGRALAAWHIDAARRLTGALADYATVERQILVRRAQLETLGESLARLRDGIARLEKRIERLG